MFFYDEHPTNSSLNITKYYKKADLLQWDGELVIWLLLGCHIQSVYLAPVVKSGI